MKYYKGQKVIWYRSTHPTGPVEAEFIDQKGKRARITIKERGGAFRSLMVQPEMLESAEKAVDGTPHLSANCFGFRGV